MTANPRVITDEREEVLRAPLQALRFSPQDVRQAGGVRRGAREGARTHPSPSGHDPAVRRDGAPSASMEVAMETVRARHASMHRLLPIALLVGLVACGHGDEGFKLI